MQYADEFELTAVRWNAQSQPYEFSHSFYSGIQQLLRSYSFSCLFILKRDAVEWQKFCKIVLPFEKLIRKTRAQKEFLVFRSYLGSRFY